MSQKRTRRGRDGTTEDVHDILAAEAFAVPEADPSIHPHPVVLPEDPTGILEAHDILAAEEFAMPSGRPFADRTQASGSLSKPRLVVAVVLVLLFLSRRRRG